MILLSYSRRCWSFLRPFYQQQHVRSLSQQSNPTLEWKGAAHSTSGFVSHVLVEEEGSTSFEQVSRVLSERKQANDTVTELNALELMRLGAVWFLPFDAPRDPARGIKPVRLFEDLNLRPGDYLRVHHNPRRFLAVKKYDWSASKADVTSDKPGIIVARNASKGWMVIDKPPNVPVHMTVDNSCENVASCLEEVLCSYATTPQRLDQNTSGLLVVSTSKVFANYYADLLRHKTALQLEMNQTKDTEQSPEYIHKKYRCLVCLQEDDDKSVLEAARELQQLRGSIICHYLEPSIRAPKNFVPHTANSTWLECLLRITGTSDVYALVGHGQKLANNLWSCPAEDRPPSCQAVMELEIELLTGRTHQVRGQLSAMGFPIVGDTQYGGAIPKSVLSRSDDIDYQDSAQLALQCCALEFADPDIVGKSDGTESMRRSQRWNSFELDAAWWTPFLRAYDSKHNASDGSPTDATTNLEEETKLEQTISLPPVPTIRPPRPDLLPPRVSLSKGANKYVLIRATHPLTETVECFVKSAAPSECGGPYHGNVAQDLREWISAAGYTAEVTGGGRIDYDGSKALVYGFSYGFGKGDHAKAVELIRKFQPEIDATFDNTDGLY
jgi:23S rRNA-/tRNA-specific pseudouridylate synthase